MAAAGTVTFLGAWFTGFSAGSIGLVRQIILGPAERYNEQQQKVCKKYDQIISKIHLATDKLESKYSSCEDILEAERDILNETIILL